MVIIDQWSIMQQDDLQGNFRFHVVCGNVYNHPEYHDGVRICTGSITSYASNIVMTTSGEAYKLGSMSESYLNWRRRNYLPDQVDWGIYKTTIKSA
jgi:hypothetical protein